VLAALVQGTLAPPAEAWKPARASASGIHYYGESRVTMDAVWPREGTHPAVIVVFGGGWDSGSKRSTKWIAWRLAKQGFAAFNVDYTLARKRRPGFPIQVDQVSAAVEYVREHAATFGVDPTRIGALGVSSGGHLAAEVATAGTGELSSGDRLGAVVTWSAPFALQGWARPKSSRLGPLVKRFLGCSGCRGVAAAASPMSHVSADDPPMLIANGTHEMVPLIQARGMGKRLRANGVPTQVLRIRGSNHGQDYRGRVIHPSIAFLRTYLGPAIPVK
jgi:acetyl esterase/lipase